MKVKIFYGVPQGVERQVNEFLENIPVLDIHQLDALAFARTKKGDLDCIAVLVWLKE